MKKLSLLGLPVLALIGFTSCEADTDPKIDTTAKYKFELNTPQFATQYIDLATNGSINFTVSQPNYGVTIVPVYSLEMSLKSDFSPLTDSPVKDSEGNEHVVPGTYVLNLDGQEKGVLVTKMSDIAAGINDLLGLYDQEMYESAYPDGDGFYGEVYFRASSTLGDGKNATTTVSNSVILTQVQGYAAFPSSEIILSVPGGANSWNHLPQIIYTGDSDSGAMICKGFAVVEDSFKITDGDWDGSGNWGGSLTDNGDGTYSGTLVQNSQDNYSDFTPGLYYFYVELTDMKNGNDNAEVGKFTMTQITSICLPGDYNGWDAAANPMKDDGNHYSWTGGASVTSAGWKFAMNGSWDINLGGDKSELTFDGPNLTLEGSTITLNLEQYPWTCTVQ